MIRPGVRDWPSSSTAISRRGLYLGVFAAEFLLAAWLLTWNLGATALWADEAETALLAEGVLRTGLPTIDERAGWITARDMHWVNADGVWTWTPWLDEYTAAASFALFGASATSARLPFAIAALVAVAGLLWLTWRLDRDRQLVALVGLLLATSTPLVEHGRQCRYYALVVAAQIWLLYGLSRAWRGEYRAAAVHLGLALGVQFHANFFVPLANLCGLCLAAACGGARRKDLFKAVAPAVVLLFLLAIPWLAFARPLQQGQNFSLARIGLHLGYYAAAVNLFVVPLAIPIMLGAISLMRRAPPFRSWRAANVAGGAEQSAGIEQRAQASRARELSYPLFWLSIGYLVPLCCLQHDAFRYLLPLLPVFYLLLATQLRYTIKSTAIRWALIVVMVGTRWLADPAGWWPAAHYPVQALAAAVARPEPDRIDDVVAWLRPRVASGDELLVVEDELPLAFHLDVRLVPAAPFASRGPDSLAALIERSLSGDMVEVDAHLAQAGWPHWLLGGSISRAFRGRLRLKLTTQEQSQYKQHDVSARGLRPDPYEPRPVVPRGYVWDTAPSIQIFERRAP
jgi:4-amino-4-deoxy-L-arabinose transferase-like glycosyltransferase